MNADLERIRKKLIERWESIPDKPPARDVDELCRRACGLVRLISWIDINPDASLQEYRALMAEVVRGRDEEEAA